MPPGTILQHLLRLLKLTGHDIDMGARRIVLMGTAGVVAVLAVVLVLLRWDTANKIAVVVSALAAVAAVGVAIWAALPAVSWQGHAGVADGPRDGKPGWPGEFRGFGTSGFAAQQCAGRPDRRC